MWTPQVRLGQPREVKGKRKFYPEYSLARLPRLNLTGASPDGYYCLPSCIPNLKRQINFQVTKQRYIHNMTDIASQFCSVSLSASTDEIGM
ncbi:hypothetical protein GLOTRDRAFT_109165 [Gloeophyllum trabeum ATCC 11539]|uniref:Uncharacterized protein n=1 Tax=Gloeophyllum trabeum (strain ATCC 11539 / FP-39264 / Madison 617) TaxID=670483 RepID=S7QN42_GLOTA|nr:uncharacterized protein GLOTRDRAFT_109165 [Gloeophyllum trabeum ATCC 11539]EPQ60837.1 hypothetical protein GLOTRDRAFT_109165 [Gloeophyllum trabeum ATCC 11539]